MPTNADLIQLEDDRPLQDFVPVNCVSNNKKVSTATSIWTGWARRPSTTASSVQGDEDDFFGCGLDEDNRTFFCSPPPPPEELRPRGSQESVSSSVAQLERWPKPSSAPGWPQSRDARPPKQVGPRISSID
eukprot:Protomagalhaensia_wolfi_Nauph_80__5639@NODE_650_length_2161_cov_140_795476_g486_i0_p2_GENE_NODE_650_length_2161_cov_140_795476_g486_i0NODE_650_length_2161_cov_140_795476_g486_i0_p2_ORF_typecomplete_len131_score10_53CholecysARec_N/PF09193_10/0_14_NODE_650_length_2161_cov_140_795476_g486_i061453